jgi:hypothetical protein
MHSCLLPPHLCQPAGIFVLLILQASCCDNELCLTPVMAVAVPCAALLLGGPWPDALRCCRTTCGT